MNKKWIAASAVSLMVLGAGGLAAADNGRRQIEIAYQDIQLQVDGQTVPTDDEPFLYVDKGRTFVPARPLAEALGASVEWDAENNAVNIKTPNLVESEDQGDSVIWKLPAMSLAFQTPAGFSADKRPGELMGLEMLTQYNGTRVTVRNLYRPRGVKLGVQAHDFAHALLEDISADDIKLTKDAPVVTDDDYKIEVEYKISGTATVIQEFPYHFAVRVVDRAEGSLVIAAYGPDFQHVDLQQIVDSFTWR